MKGCAFREPEPLTIPLVKVLECGHERNDFSPVKPGRSVHCWQCPGLRDVVDVYVTVKLTGFNRDRLEEAGFTRDEIRQMVAPRGRS